MVVTGSDLISGIVLLLLGLAVAGIWRTNATLATIRADIAYMKETLAQHAQRLDKVEHHQHKE
jgi:hypothetical protein